MLVAFLARIISRRLLWKNRCCFMQLDNGRLQKSDTFDRSLTPAHEKARKASSEKASRAFILFPYLYKNDFTSPFDVVCLGEAEK